MASIWAATRSHIVVLSTKGELKKRLELPTPELPSWLKKRKPSRVVMEACTQSTRIAEASRAAQHETFVMPGQVVRALGVGARVESKTADPDAQVLARASVSSDELPSVHTRSEQSRSQKEMLFARANCKCAMTIPGIGAVTAVAFVAAVDDPNRFESSEQLASHMGLAPGEDTTGGKITRTGAIKAGPKYIRSLLVQCVWSCRVRGPTIRWCFGHKGSPTNVASESPSSPSSS